MKYRNITQTMKSQETSDGAGVRIKRSIGTPQLDYLDPFLMLDEFGSEDGADYIAGFPDHPHRGFETVTLMLDGLMRHKDSTGNEGLLSSGGVQWMTAGRGIIHSEMPEQEDGLMRGFQLWVNLPSHLKMCEPRYQNIEPHEVPMVEDDNGNIVSVIAGQALGVQGPISEIYVEPLYLDITISANNEFTQPIPEEHNAFCYGIEGSYSVEGDTLEAHTLAVLGAGDTVKFTNGTDTPARLILVAGKPIGEPVAKYGPFVMNTKEEIHQAINDFRSGNLG